MDIEKRVIALEAQITELQSKQTIIEDLKEANAEFVNENKRAQEFLERYEKLTDEGIKHARENSDQIFAIVRGYKERIDDIERRTHECYYHLFPQMLDVDIALSDAAKAAGKEKKNLA